MNISLPPPVNLFTVDVEEYLDVESFSGVIDRNNRSAYPQRVENNTNRLLEILASFNVKATFFILGTVAEKYPSLVRKIDDIGHDVASHGYDHRMVTRMSRDEFREDIRKSKQILEDIKGSGVIGYRAPTFSITAKSEWAYEILAHGGYRYSSSVYPIFHDRYGWPDFGLLPRKLEFTGERVIWEIPLSAWEVAHLKFPFGGGGYLRAYPYKVTEILFRAIAKRKRPGVLYIHPWELDREHPRVNASWLDRLRHYQGIQGVEEKVTNLLKMFPFVSIENYLDLKGNR